MGQGGNCIFEIYLALLTTKNRIIEFAGQSCFLSTGKLKNETKMDIKITKKQSGRDKTLIHILILLITTLCIGIYLISTTVLIAKDGVTFIEYAKDLDLSPIEAIQSRYQHPGYPFLIIAAHKAASIGHNVSSLGLWIYSAQAAALIFRLLSIVLLYFVGRKIVGARFSFWAILILVLLPEPAKFGSDTLSDWPHLFFLSAGFSLLIWGAASRKWWLFGFSGLAAGLGYLIRPECAQIVIFGTLWLGMQMFWSKRSISKGKAVFALLLLAAGFLTAAGPYMKLKGAVFPKKQLVKCVPKAQLSEIYEQEAQIRSNDMYTSGLAPSDIAGAVGKLVERVSETLMWFFVPALLIGIYKHFKGRDWREPERFFVIALIALNTVIMILLYCKFGYMSRRHTLPLVVFTIFYIPAGLEALARWLNERFSKESNVDFWFFVLLVIGISICGPKLLRPMRAEKAGYREAARWLTENTNKDDTVAVSDLRISFYAERRGIDYRDGAIPGKSKFAVKVFGDKEEPTGEETLGKEEVFSIEGVDEKPRIVVYKRKD